MTHRNPLPAIATLAAIISLPAIAFSQQSDPAAQYADAWHTLNVPGTWDEQTDGALDNYDGFAWYRCQVTVSRGWRDRDLTLRVANIDDAWEAYWNGTKLGGAGGLPPDYAPAGADPVELAIPRDARTSGNNLLAIRVFDHDSRGGFKGSAPIVLTDAQGINLNGLWEFRLGDESDWAKGPIAVTSTGIFWRALSREQAIEFASINTSALSPADALKTIKVPDDLEIVQLLTEPAVTQPLYMTWDHRGRMWLMQYRQYPYPAGLTMVSKDEFWRAVYDKLPAPPPHGTPGLDRITIHEDTDGDGLFDSQKTFVDGLSIATSCARGRGGLWVLNPPYLLFYPDADNDDVPDNDPVVHLQGFGMEDTHSVANSLTFGPDGWLYACQGSTVSGNIFRPGIDKPEQAVTSMGQLIWRYHPEQRRYEIFAEGGGNAFGLEIDSKGRIYSGHNGGDTRGFHYVQGGYYQKGFSKHGPLSNPYTFGYFPAMKHQQVPRFTHNFIIYEGGALPQQYWGRLFGVEPLQGQVVQSEIFDDTSTFATRDIDRVVTSDDTWFRPVDIEVGPDGGVYIADLYEPQISHREHFSGQIDKTTGRVYRLQAKGAKPHVPLNLGAMSSQELIGVLRHPNRWYRQEALVVFGDRHDASVIPELKEQVRHETGQFALECLWALNLCGGFNEEIAAETLDHDDPFVRMWTVRLLCDDYEVSTPIGAHLASMAKTEPYAQVRSQLASSARRLPAVQGLPIVENLLARSEDLDDVHIPLLLWWAIEAKAESDTDLVVGLFSDPAVWELPIVKKHILSRLMRRYAASGTRNDLFTCARLLEMAPTDEAAKQLMQGFEQAFQGRSLASLPARLVEAIDASGSASPVLQVRSGKPEAVAAALDTVRDPGTDLTERVSLVQVFGEVNLPQTVDTLLQLVTEGTEPKLRMAALTALLRYDEDRIGREVARVFPDLSQDEQSAALTLLASRVEWTRALLTAVDAGRIDPKSVPLDTVRLMTVHRDDAIAALIRKHWPDVEGASNAEMQARIAQVTDVLKSTHSDPYNGKTIFMQTCGKCHLLFGDGGRIGPDLTSYQRKDGLRLLINVVNPSAEIREGFESYTVLTLDGRVLNGFLFDQDNQVIVLRGVDGQNVTIPRDQIDEMVLQKKSLMPEGILNNLTDEQVRDLFAYLKSSQPLNN